MWQTFIMAQDFIKKISERNIRLHRPTATQMGTWMVSIDTCHSLISMQKIIHEKREQNSTSGQLRVLASRMASKSRNFNRFTL